MISVVHFNKYLHFFMTMHNVRTSPSTGHFIALHEVNCYVNVLQQCKCAFKFYYIYVISINMFNVITHAIFELIIYAPIYLKCRFWICDYLLMIYNSIEREYGYHVNLQT
jgi:hypothetical protein